MKIKIQEPKISNNLVESYDVIDEIFEEERLEEK